MYLHKLRLNKNEHSEEVMKASPKTYVCTLRMKARLLIKLGEVYRQPEHVL